MRVRLSMMQAATGLCQARSSITVRTHWFRRQLELLRERFYCTLDKTKSAYDLITNPLTGEHGDAINDSKDIPFEDIFKKLYTPEELIRSRFSVDVPYGKEPPLQAGGGTSSLDNNGLAIGGHEAPNDGYHPSSKVCLPWQGDYEHHLHHHISQPYLSNTLIPRISYCQSCQGSYRIREGKRRLEVIT